MKSTSFAAIALVIVGAYTSPAPLLKRDGDCSAAPAGGGATINGNASDWLASSYWSGNATTAATPDGYTLSFSNLTASTQDSTYLDYTVLSTYDPEACARYCDASSDCKAFNLYFERDPSLSPNAQDCPDPASITNIKCARYGANITSSTATNVGQTVDSFEVVIAGSNGYNKFAPPPSYDGWTRPQELAGALSAPLDPVTGQDTYIRVATYKFGSDVENYDPSVCLTLCDQTSEFDLEHPPSSGNPTLCNQVVAYVISGGDVSKSMECAFYSEAWAKQYATNTGYWDSAGDRVDVTRAYSYTNSTYASQWGPICAVGGCPSGSYQGGNCGGWGSGTC